MSIWFKKDLSPEMLQQVDKNMGPHLQIKYTEVGKDFIVGTMPVNEKTMQPAGILHGGASCVLAETLGSIASNCAIDFTKYRAVGLEINANHLRAGKEGSLITGTATAIHLGKTTHVWNIELRNPEDKLICVSRLTMAIIKL